MADGKDINWDEIRQEYIKTNISYRELANKYGVHYTSVGRKGKEEDWPKQRQQHSDKTVTKILDADIRRKVARAERLQTVADKLLCKVEEMLEYDIGPKEMKNLSSALKDIKDLHMIRSDLDDEEQKARIAKLRREAEADEADKNRKITIEIAGGDASWAE